MVSSGQADQKERRGSGWAIVAGSAVACFALYFGAVLLLYKTLFGIHFGAIGIIALALLVGFVAWLVLRRLLVTRRTRPQTTMVIAVNLVIGFVLLLAIDLIFTLYISKNSLNTNLRTQDSELLIGEYYPRLYYPTERNFRLHKPNLSVEATSFGNFYQPGMLQSPTLRDEVLEERRTLIEINDLGFRETDELEDASVFALGDSLTFGWQVNADDSMVGQLETLIGQPIYNLGVHDGSPRQQVLLLQDILNRYGDRVDIDRLLWLIYEGNDLEDSYALNRPVPPAPGPLADTILQPIVQIPHALKTQSFITRLRTGQASPRTQARQEHDLVDGISLAHPLYASETLGPKLFYRPYIERAMQPESYVRDHPNAPALKATMEEMAALSEEHGFLVTVVLVPTGTRLHGPYFDGFPQLSERPHFLDLVGELASSNGFDIVNLLDLFAEFADSELLYFRDDDHWNLQGNQQAARLIAQEAFGIE